MTMRIAINEYKRDRDDDSHPGERLSTDGLFSGDEGRLVFVDRSGAVRDYSGSTLDMHGIDSSRYGIRVGDDVTWFDELETTRQTYEGETTMVVTRHQAENYSIHQYDYTLEKAHLTHLELRGDVPERPSLVAAVAFAPDGQTSSVGHLQHDDVVEVFHDAEHDYLTASTGFSRVVSQRREGFDELLADDPTVLPTGQGSTDDLSDTIVAEVPLDAEGSLAQTTLVSLVADHGETSRSDALAHVHAFADHYQTDRAIRNRAVSRNQFDVPDVPHRETVVSDLRTLSLLTAPTGARIKGPEFDPHHVYSGGYGYSWFRDDAEVARHLLTVDSNFGIDLSEQHAASARFYADAQLSDGTWAQRVWAHNGRLAPGWGNGRITGDDGVQYPADGTASVLAYLARYLRLGSPDTDLVARITGTIEDGLDALEELLADDGFPKPCQDVWESDTGRFTHTAASMLLALSAIARAPVDETLRLRASDRADEVYDAIGERWHDSGVFERAPGDDTLDVSTLALVCAHREYAAANDTLDQQRIDRLVEHTATTVEGLSRYDADGELLGLVRFEGDGWRKRGQDESKLWPLAVGWAASANADLGGLIDEYGARTSTDESPVDAAFERARMLLDLIQPGGQLAGAEGYLSEQAFDDGTPDSATPFAWAHGLRSAVVARLHENGALSADADLTQPSGPAAHSTWTTGETYGVGTAADHWESNSSRVWFTLTEGAMTEPRFPRVDLMNFRTVDFLVVDADEESSYTARTHNEERTDDAIESIERSTTMVGSESPVFRQTITETGSDGHEWELVVEYVTDPGSESIVMDVNFAATDSNQYDVYVVGDAALSGYMDDKSAEIVDDGDGYALAAWDTGAAHDPSFVDPNGEPYQVAAAIASHRSFDWATVGEASAEHLSALFGEGATTESEPKAGPGHSVLVGRVGNATSSIADTVALGFAENADTELALAEAQRALSRGYVGIRDEYVDGWREYLDAIELPASVSDDPELANQYRAAVMVLKAVEDKTFLGAGIASPSVPWGENVDAGDPRDFGYNFTWARDLYQVFTALETVGDLRSATEATEYIYEYQQRPNGFISQNTFLDGRIRWGGEQLDNVAFPSVMAYQLWNRHGVGFDDVSYDYEHVRRSVEYLLRSGPRSGQERWEEEAGYSPSTIAAEIAGVTCAAPLAAAEGRRADAIAYLGFADYWRTGVDRWCATYEGTDQHDRAPYYIRVSRNGDPDSGVKRELANNGPTLDERDIIDGGFLELVRLGIRDPDYELIENSIDVADDTIRVETPNGPGWYRYNGDGYGEMGETEPDEGGPWSIDRNGSGRLWPIFTGERAEYELVAGTETGEHAPAELLKTMQRFANDGRMIPEQVWDREYPTEFDWEFGEGTGAATPLAWSMAQFVRLADAVDAGQPVETPAFVRRRYRDIDPDGPPLSVDDVELSDGEATVAGTTRGDEVVLWTADGTTLATVEDERFEATVEVRPGTESVSVIAATDADELAAVGTTLTSVRFD
ncbi:glucan 1,4-alpha-glucosidase [Natronoarchaeum philippinense]|uniref:Glucan 1,4-alpha-glucosidase n=1 Tax=Natronoarchaeum philippinense TaxID=558529 RepID=A0A285N579_NATPI|nr:glycoside hydrolase family 15 protein [Natronoarchaeum philippinense]SNZ04478.1 glucan 1,4-alpha-glucosidase [Natronoarchaeum philippinense]